MRSSSLYLHDENTIEKTVIIARPVKTVYDFYRDFRNLPKFIGDVMNVVVINPTTSRWTIQGPFGIQTHWTVEIVEELLNEFLHYRTVSSPRWRTSWKIYFCPEPEANQSKVREVMTVPLGKLGRAALGLLGKLPAE